MERFGKTSIIGDMYRKRYIDEQAEDIARDITRELSSEASVKAVLYEKTERPTDQLTC